MSLSTIVVAINAQTLRGLALRDDTGAGVARQPTHAAAH
jgi:hypothetical protein